ncbi:hypothetical protein O3M35_012466 [Rhynocoris fuscipes]|uniref:HMG box domain-containing protein n=1 Tax=Rhynocoris fuscipes TaxID=488301 RepID=A0AAW1CT66_9HEMI
MGAYSSKKLLKYFSYGIKYLNTIPKWKKSQYKLGGKEYETAKQKIRLMPTTSSFFNLLRSIKERYPQLSQTQIVMIGSHVWSQLTWPEKKPFYVAAWKQQFKRDIQRRKLNMCNMNGRLNRVPTPEKRLKYNLRSKKKVPSSPGPLGAEKEPLEEKRKLLRRPKSKMTRWTSMYESDTRLFLPIKHNALSVVNNLLENSNEELIKSKLKTIIAS